MNAPNLLRDMTGLPRAALLALTFASWTLCALVAQTAPWRMFELRMFDYLMVLSAPNKSSFPITVIGIDEASFSKFGLQWPWPRRLHAELVDSLAAAGAAVIVFDLVFSEASNKEDDLLFAESIRRAGNVVLAADRVYRESSSVRQWLRIEPHPKLVEAGAQVGFATVPLDPDLVIRQIPDSSDALWRAVILRLLREHPDLTPNLGIEKGSYVRYVGPDHSFPYVSYHEVIEPDGSLPNDFFKDQVVIIGRDVKASPDVESVQADLFATAFTAQTGWLIPGAEVHANIIETALAKSAITRVPEAFILGLLALVSVTCGLVMRRWRPLLSAVAGLFIAVVLTGLGWGVFIGWHLWLPIGSLLLTIPLMYVSIGGWSYVTEQIRQREITRAFSLYVTPQVVNQLIEHPERINLHGELRQVTILFTDLAGFTTISERLSPERVTQLLNYHFTEMTDIVLEHHGTVARFIGDAVMAFWGAPLDDPEQAGNAVAAAVAMQKAMESQRMYLQREGLPPIHMRIGIHSGQAVVGNLGSAKRFDYTAIGDDVNLAARLEGINKLYGTGITVSGETVRRVGDQFVFRPVDRVVVKGKSQPVDVFTPCDNARIVTLSTQILEQFRARKWDTAESLLQDLLALSAEDAIALLYVERIARLRLEPLPEDWNGAVELEKY